MGYHINEIPRGKYGDFSKIEEEFLEAKDAISQRADIMLLQELSDLIGAIEGFVVDKFSMTLRDLIIMKDITSRAFNDGTRTAKDE